MSARYVLRFDDIAPNMRWDRFHRVEAWAERYALKPLIGVIPENRDPTLLAQPSEGDFWSHMRRLSAQGWQVAVHGYQHLYLTKDGGLLGLNRASEFAGLPYEAQREKLAAGMAVLSGHGLASDVFMAPAHSYDRATLRACRELGIRYVSDGLGFFPYLEDDLVFVPQLFAMPRPMPAGVYTSCIHLNECSDQRLDALEAFLESHHRQFVAFKDAAAEPAPGRAHRLAGRLLRRSLSAAQRLRKRTPGAVSP